jgi:hypothetical protein
MLNDSFDNEYHGQQLQLCHGIDQAGPVRMHLREYSCRLRGHTMA